MRSLFSRSKSSHVGVTRGKNLAELGVWARTTQSLLRVEMRYEGTWQGGDGLSVTYCFLPIHHAPFWQSLEIPFEFVELLVGSHRAESGTFYFNFLFSDSSAAQVSLTLAEVYKRYRGRGPKAPASVAHVGKLCKVAPPEWASLDATGLVQKSEEIVEAERQAEEARKKAEEERVRAEKEALQKAQAAAAAKRAGSAVPKAAPSGAPAEEGFDTGGAKVGIFYGSTTGNTAGVAEALRAEIGDALAKVVNVTEVTPKVFEKFDHLILGVPTWHIGEMQEDWAEMLTRLEGTNLKGKKCAVFGLGDGVGYPETYVDAMGELWEAFKPLGAELVGLWPTAGYVFEKSKAVQDGKFLGLVIDIENQNDQTDARVKQWASELRTAMAI
ncbi:MAG: flavodoxin [Bdellovibrionales bacterium]|nr:flavodoxin [Bdellovibrionales bacterium]